MIILLLFLYSFSGLTVTGAIVDFKANKPVICAYNGNGSSNPDTPVMDPNTIPTGCETIIFTGCTAADTFTCTDFLKDVTGSDRTVLLQVSRDIKVWTDLLKPEGNEADAKCITEYATTNGAQGVLLEGISPLNSEDPVDGTLAACVVPYINQLKSKPDFIVGLILNAHQKLLTNPCTIDYAATNPIVDLYIVNTYMMNAVCQADKFNGLTPINGVDPLIGLDTVIGWLNGTAIEVDKVYLVADLYANDPDSMDGLASYSHMCSANPDTTKWCAPTTSDYFNKGKFICEQKFGVAVFWIEQDDVDMSCECCDICIGFRNIVAGCKCSEQISCTKYDVKGDAPPP